MFGILAAAANYLLGLLLRGVVIKFGVLTALFYVIGWIVEALLSKLDISPVTGLQTLLQSVPDGVLFFMSVFRFDVGLPLILSAMVTSFLIRRLPVIG